MTGYDAFLLYQAIKLHFTSDSYDFFKYQGKYRCSVETYEKRNDRYFYHKLSRKYPETEDLTFFLATNFFLNKKMWVRELFDEQANDRCLYRKRVKESLVYRVTQDMDKLGLHSQEKMKEVLHVRDGEPPMLLQAAWQGDIHNETLIVLNAVIGFFPIWSKKMSDTVIFPDYRQQCERYAPFLQIDVKKFQDKLKLQLMMTK